MVPRLETEMAPYAASVFVPATEDGMELRDLLRPVLAEAGFEMTMPPTTMAAMTTACLNDDLVVFDGTVGPGDIYDAANGYPMVLDHVLVVARTWLPFNYFSVRTGGAPTYGGRRTNRDIVAWVSEQVADLTLPRPGKGLLRSFRQMSHSLDVGEARMKARGSIFVSYRAGGTERVRAERQRLLRELAARVTGGADGRSINIYPPGALAFEDEILTEAQHWQVTSSIERQVWAADEVWILDTPDYLGSWWTQAELVGLAYRRRRRDSAAGPRLRIVDPDTLDIRDAPEDYLPRLTEPQARRLARWWANTDPGETGPEAVPMFQMMSQLPLIGRWRYVRDPVWSDEFWRHPLIRCTASPADPPADGASIDMDQFLWAGRRPGVFRIDADVLEKLPPHGSIPCRECGGMIEIDTTSPPRYTWIRKLPRPGYEGHAEEVPVYRAIHP
jgi:hypothetical protein